MLLDFLNEFADADDLSGNATTVYSGGLTPVKAIDLAAAAPPQIQNGEPLKVYFQVTAALAGGTSANIQLITGSAEDGTGTNTVHDQTGAITVVSGILAVGYQGTLVMQPNNPAPRRYMMIAVVHSGNNTTFNINAGIAWDLHNNEQATWTGISAVTGF